MKNDYQVLLYYLYTHIQNPEQFRDEHLEFCNKIGVLGRILVSEEGINGTISGTKKQAQQYITNLENDERFKGITFKIDDATEHAFNKLSVKVKKELVNLSLEDDVNPLEITGTYLKPKDFYQAMQEENTVVI